MLHNHFLIILVHYSQLTCSLIVDHGADYAFRDYIGGEDHAWQTCFQILILAYSRTGYMYQEMIFYKTSFLVRISS